MIPEHLKSKEYWPCMYLMAHKMAYYEDIL